tara:strand:+ start:1338 stop:1529 length:192 start_codon:yes stop_codon:yes gene_type:complete
MNEEASIGFKIKQFVRESVRVLKVTKKPDKLEFTTIVKASGLGMLIIGMLGFVIHMLRILFFQ